MFDRRTVSVAVAVAVLVGGLAIQVPASRAAVDTSPRLRLIAGAHGATFNAMSGSGAHLFISSGYDPVTGESGSYLLYDTIGGRYTPTAVGTSTAVFDRMSRDGSAHTFIPSHRLVDEDEDDYPDLYLHSAGANILLDPDLSLTGNTLHVANGGAFVIVRTVSNLAPDDLDGLPDDYIWEATTGDFRLIDGPPGQQVTAVSPDDSTIFLQDPFGATSTWADGVATSLTTGTIQWMSETGDRIHVNSEAALIPGDTDGAWDAYEVGPSGTTLISDGFEIPIWMSGHVSTAGDRWVLSSTFPFDADDTDNAHNDNVLVTADGMRLAIPGGEEHAYIVGASADLSTLIIQTLSQLTAADQDQGLDLYRWSMASPSEVQLLTSGTDRAEGSLEAISPDGRRIVIVTDEPLVAEPRPETAVHADIYEWFDDALISLTPDTTKAVQFVAVSEDAQRVVFGAADSLVPEDVDLTADLYVSDRDVTPPVATVEVSASAGATAVQADTPGGVVTAQLATKDDDGVFFDCRLDEDAFRPCTETTVFSGVPDGRHAVSVRAFDAAANPSTIVTASVYVGEPPLDSEAPIGAVSIEGGEAYAGSTSVTVSTVASDESGVSDVALSNDGSDFTTRPYAPSQAWTLVPGNGPRTVFVRWRDAVGNWSEVSTDTVILDTVAPTTGKPGRAFVKGRSLVAGAIATRIAWTGSDATSGIGHYELHQQTDAGAWVKVSDALTKTLTDRPLATLHTYRFRVRAVDRAGHVGAWTYGDTFRVSRYSESNARISYSGTWSTLKASAFWGGASKASSRAGSRASITFTGRSVAWVSSLGPTRGKADVYVNGSKVATVDLYSPTAKHQQVVWTSSWATAASRTVSIRVLGTTGRPRVDLDAIVTAN